MGNNKFKLTKLALALGLTASLSACFSDNDNNDYVEPPVVPPVLVDVPVADTPAALAFYVSGSVVQKSTGNVIPANIKFFEAGEPSANVVDLNGTAITEVNTEDGSFAFNLAEGAEVSKLKLIVSNSPDFNSKAFVIDFADVDLNSAEPLEALVRLTKIDTSLAKATATGTTTNGQLASAINLDAPADSGSASVAIGADVTLLAADGTTPITDGDVSLTVLTADIDAQTDKAGAIDLLPDGLNESSESSVEVPVSVMSVELLAGDTKVKNFDTPITLTANMPSTINGKTITAGDEFNVSSYNEDTGEWQVETNKAIVGAAGTATLPASTQATHLSTWVFSFATPACTIAPTYTVTGLPGGATVPLVMNLESPQFSFSRPFKKETGNLFLTLASVLGVATDTTVGISITDKNGLEWGSLANVNVCGAVTIPLTQPYQIINEDVNLTYTCSNAEIDQDKPFPLTGAQVTYAQANKLKTPSVEANGAYSLVGLQQGADYDVLVTPRLTTDGVTIPAQQFTITADGTAETFNFDRDNCKVEQREVTGTGTTGGS
ncbi:hypothetical protein RC083_10365 [Pseudoalteromonas haloplanktis]|uniref:Carboxypeptidase regulatory-like domain-containing protein n=1 Tax=Pseudoalteromonas haloplanktis TaxID=228 RepID=A0ABU1BBZ7_PSEHA|nr:hypothetical protein [Pseudoalteromonas haloplanktis]MDQ9091993.1 hypothetical protein [Pseudoalteromonas haloplanktis]